MSGAGASAPAPSQGRARFADAVRTLSDPVAVEGLAYQKRKTWEARGSVPDLVKFASAVLRECQRRGFPMVISEAWRDGVRQDELYRKGFSKARAGQSAHNHGMAFDLIHWKRGWNLNEYEWAVVGALMHEVARRMKVDISWGGDDVTRWKLSPPPDGVPVKVDRFRWDPAHVELRDWKERAGK